MREDLVFHRTALGQSQLDDPASALTPKLRRCLALVDGTKSVAELESKFRPGEIDLVLGELQAGGCIASG